jgi:pyridoxine 5-phosphate synthase
MPELAALPGLRLPPLRLGVNIDHVATIRNARGGSHPDPVRAALLAAEAGADGITVHLREDRRHITDDDLARLSEGIFLPINLEMAATDEMLAIALRHRPHAVCLVPERRQERTTEGGLDAAGQAASLKPIIATLASHGIRVSLFIEPDARQIDAAATLGAAVVEFHTGRYCHTDGPDRQAELERLRHAALIGAQAGLEIHAGHGLTYASVRPIAAISQVVELNIGHFLIGEAVFVGLAEAIRRMRAAMDSGRREAASLASRRDVA